MIGSYSDRDRGERTGNGQQQGFGCISDLRPKGSIKTVAVESEGQPQADVVSAGSRRRWSGPI